MDAWWNNAVGVAHGAVGGRHRGGDDAYVMSRALRHDDNCYRGFAVEWHVGLCFAVAGRCDCAGIVVHVACGM